AAGPAAAPPAGPPAGPARGPGAGPTSSAGAAALPSGMVGTWSGTLTQSATADRAEEKYNVTLTLRGGEVGDVVGTSNYPTIPCGGDLVLEQTGTRVQVTEQITTGTENCADEVTVFLELESTGTLLYHFDDAGFGAGDAVLTKQR
ncbi:hypothetical protein I6A84_15915, partial [Frankia sp. CNm7]|nr:hypothetical protein [Frankia nepalensis]